MSRQIHFFDQPRRFVVGTVGQPGERTFFLQAADGARVVSVALEKSQVSVLAERMEQLLAEMALRAGIELPGELPPTPTRWRARSTRSSGSRRWDLPTTARQT